MYNISVSMIKLQSLAVYAQINLITSLTSITVNSLLQTKFGLTLLI